VRKLSEGEGERGIYLGCPWILVLLGREGAEATLFYYDPSSSPETLRVTPT
jgi:hypothetical protein